VRSLKHAGPGIEKIIRNRFLWVLGRSGPGWAPLADSTLRASKDRQAPKPFATRSKRMWSALAHEESPQAYRVYADDYIEVGEKDTPAVWHAERRTKPGTTWVLPARPMTLSRWTRLKIVDYLARYYTGKKDY
jgi:hypothetical protein